MRDENLLPPLAEDPRDARGRASASAAGKADEVLYRLGLHCLPVPGLPPALAVDDVAVHFVRGPIRAQRTEIRQRHQVPFVFDKQMLRVEVGEGEAIAVFSVRERPVPHELNRAFDRWRARALAAAGLVTAVLDERVAGHELFEDAILLRSGSFVGAADLRAEVRTFMPFDVNAADLHAMEQLEQMSLSETSAVARAARLYRRAALEGPTADAYAMLWVAAECFNPKRTPSRKEIESALEDAGLDPSSLPLHVGILIGLRGDVQHQGLEADDRLRTAFYEMEAVVRALIRQHSQLRGGWWPASDNPAAFAEPFNHALAALLGPGETVWHRDSLPPVEEPEPLHLPRLVPIAIADPRVDIDPAFGAARELVANAVIDAIEWQNPNTRLAVVYGRPADVPEDITAGANANRIFLVEDKVEGFDDPDNPIALINLVWDLHGLVGAVIAQQAGLVSEGPEAAVIEAVGAFAQYQRLVAHGEFDARSLQLPHPDALLAIGKLAGWAAAGDSRARRRLRFGLGQNQRLGRAIAKGLRQARPAAPVHVIELGRKAARARGLKPDW